MITLHGFSSSNYYNIVKYVMLYKSAPFQENVVYGGGEEWLAISPVGKIPAITTDDGHHLSETRVICDYLDAIHPQPSLYPIDPLERARVRQIMQVSELYLELPSRKLIPYEFSGKPAPEAVLADARNVLKRGVGAMQRLCRFSPFIGGDSLTLADVYVHYANAVVNSIGSKQLEWDILGEISGMWEWHKRFAETAIAQSVEADRRSNEPEFQAYIRNFMAQSNAGK